MKSLPVMSFPPEQLAKLQADYAQEMQQLWQQGLQTNPVLKDRRFAAEAWQHNPVAAFNAAMYLLNARTLLSMSDMVDTDEKTRARIRFSIEQWVAAAAPRLASVPRVWRLAPWCAVTWPISWPSTAASSASEFRYGRMPRDM